MATNLNTGLSNGLNPGLRQSISGGADRLGLFRSSSLDLRFADKKTLTDRVSGKNLITFSRSSGTNKGATYVDSGGLIKTSPVNLLRYSERFDESAWVKYGSVVAANTTTAPDGTLTAEKLREDGGNSFHRIRQSITDETTGNFSIYVKADERNKFEIGTSDSVVIAVFDLSSESVTSGTGTIESESNGWYRCSVNGTFTTNGPYFLLRNNTSEFYQGDNSSGLYVWGAQLEKGDTTPSEYIPTQGTASGAPRFDHDPVTGESLGLLIEEERTNLLKYSEPDNRSSSTIGTVGEWSWQDLNPNTQITKVEGPDGVSNSASEMDLASGNSWDAYGRVGATGVTAGLKCTFSAWVKLGTATNFVLVPNGTANWNNMPDGWRSFDASDGLNTTSFTKVSHTFTAPAGGTINLHIGRHASIFTTQQTAGTVTVWGCQFEMGDFDTSTLITDGNTKTRSPDVVTIEGNKFAKTNLLSYSERFDELTVGANTTVTPNVAVAPDGTNTADRIYNPAAATTFVQLGPVTAGTTYTVSVYAKAVTPGTNDKFTFNIGGSPAGPTSISPLLTATNEWQRFNFTHTPNTSGTAYINNEGDGFISDIYAWAVQLELGDEMTDYTPSVDTFVSRASSATYVDDATGLIKTTPVNLMTYSEQFDQWAVGSNTTVTPNAATAPDGTGTAYRVQMPATNSTFINQSNKITSGTEYTGSVWVKAVTPGTNDQFTFQYGSGSGGAEAFSTFTATNEWRRVSSTATATTSGNFNINNHGDGFESDIYVWGAQLEKSSTASPYIKTTNNTGGAARYENGKLLLEPARTNILRNSTNYALGQIGTSPPSIAAENNVVLPSGELGQVSKVTFQSGYSVARTAINGSFSGTYRASIFWKPVNGGTWTRKSRSVGNTGSFLYADWTAPILGIDAGTEIYMAFSQIELGAYTTSYIPTDSTVGGITRAADVSTSAPGVDSWYNQSEGTVFSDFMSLPGNNIRNEVVNINNGSLADRISISNKDVNAYQAQIYAGNVIQLRGDYAFASNRNVALAYKANDANYSYDGLIGTQDTSVTLPVVNQVEIGYLNDYLNGHIKRLSYFPTRKTDQQLVNMTS
jgi:hypothetical protein